MTRWCFFCGPARSKTPRTESFFWWSLVTLPNSSVGSQVTISWPWPYQNTFRDPTYILIAYDPTDQLVTVSMGFVWQVQQFRCLWDVLPWPSTCWLGSVKWLLCGRCNNFDASEMFSPDPIHACWEGSQVIDSDFVWPAQYFQCLREVLCDPMFGDTGDPMFGDTGDPTCFLCGRCRILDGSEKFLVYTFCLCGRRNILDTSEKVNLTLREVPRDTSSVLWQVPSLPRSSSAWPYTFALCGRRNIFRCLRTFFARPGPKGRLWPHLLSVWQVQIIGDNGDPTFFLCGRCNIFDASGKFLVTLFLFCVAGALVTRPPRSTLWPHVLFVWQVLYVRCLREVPVTGTQGSLVTPPLFLCGRPPRSSADTAKGWLWPYVLFVWGENFDKRKSGRVADDPW